MKCGICGKDCNGVQALSQHIGKVHNINTVELKKDYFDKYRKYSTGFCLTCHKPTKYLDFTQGYANYCSYKCNPEYKNNEIYVCELCNEDFIWKKDLCQHLKRKHNQDIKLYYDTYIKKKNEGICPVCKKPTKFNSLFGYKQYCSVKCQHSDPEYNKKIAQSTFEHYGVYNGFCIPEVHEKAVKMSQTPEVREKRKQTCLEKYRYENPMQSKEIQQKGIQTLIERYGDTNLDGKEIKSPMHIKAIAQKAKKNKKSKHNGKLGFNTDKQKQTMIERYGAEHTLQNEQIKQKQQQTMKNRYGVISPLCNSTWMQESNMKKYGIPIVNQNNNPLDKELENPDE